MKIEVLILALGLYIQFCNGISRDWWERGNFYQIYPRSFKDSNGDGVGDLRGIIQKLDYLKELGITGVWLSPIFKSPMADFGYDISDYYLIQPEYGTNDDFIELVEKAKKMGLKIILDFVPNHTSDEHQWFIRSKQNDTEFADYYIWHPGTIDPTTGERKPPNNWVSIFRFSAWEWVEERQAYYLHQFAKQQPDLNYRNPAVVKAMKDVLKYWMDRGVAGFRVDAIPFLYEVQVDEKGQYKDEPLSNECDDPDSYCYIIPTYTKDLNETYDMVFQWREVLENYTASNGGESRILMTEAYTTLDNTIRFFGTPARYGSHIPFNFELISKMKKTSAASDFQKTIHSWLDKIPVNYPSNWVLGNHDNKRLASRFGVERVDLFNILLQTLPGIAITYNGEEIGMTDVHITWAETVDPAACNTNQTVYDDYSRDPARTPFQWDDTTSAGFSTNTKTWLPVADDYATNNVKAQKVAARSHLKVFKALVELRQTIAIQEGSFEDKIHQNNVYMYRRNAANEDFVIVVLNFSETRYTLNLRSFFRGIPGSLHVITSSIQSKYSKGDVVNPTSILVPPYVGTVFYGTYV